MAPQIIENQRQTLSQLAGYVRVLNVITAIVQLTAGIATLIKLQAFTVSKILIASYVLLFALLLLCFEGSFSETDPFLRRNFGFLYSYQGLGLYLLFIGLMDLCLSGGFFGIVAGIVAVVTAIIIFLSGVFLRKSFEPEHPSSITSTIHDAVDKLPSYGSVKTNGEQVADQAAAKAAVVKDDVVEIAGHAADKTKQVASAAKDAAADALEKGEQVVGQRVSDVKETAGKVGTKMSETTQSVKSTLASKLSS